MMLYVLSGEIEAKLTDIFINHAPIMINDADNSEIQAEWDLLNDLFLNDLPSSWNPYTVKAEACFLDQNAEDSLTPHLQRQN